MQLRRLCLLLVSMIIIASGCSRVRPDRDNLLDWYRLPTGAIFPVLKLEGAYYTVCNGVEAPLKECPNGLEWALTPSGMKGTRILSGDAPGTAILAKNQNPAAGEKITLTRVSKPPAVPDAQAPPPKSINDFLGWFQPQYYTFMRFGISKEGDKYYSTEQVFDGRWQNQGQAHEIVSLPDGAGFAGADGRNTFSYNGALRRFETTDLDPERRPALVRVPLVRIPPPSAGEAAPQDLKIGIPIWQ